MADLLSSLQQKMEELERKKIEALKKLEEESNQESYALRTEATRRLEEIQATRNALNKEEEQIRNFLRLPARKAKATGAKGGTRVSSGKRMSKSDKAAVVAEFISAGHIQANAELSTGVRAALKDRGFQPYDFPKIKEYMPAGWTADFNGQRGRTAKTIFRKG